MKGQIVCRFCRGRLQTAHRYRELLCDQTTWVSGEAVRYAVALSKAYKAELILLHCDTGDGLATQDAEDSNSEDQ